MKGDLPVLPKWGDHHGTDNAWISADTPEEVRLHLDTLLTRDLPAMGFDSVSDVQILVPVRKGPLGVERLNPFLQATMNPPATGKPEVAHRTTVFRLGDKVIQRKNDYDKRVMNGEIGRVVEADPRASAIWVQFDSELVEYDGDALEALELAYAITIHKAQGSEAPCVVLPVLPEYGRMLFRTLLYTGWTRFRKFIVAVGSMDALQKAVAADYRDARLTALGSMMRASVDPEGSSTVNYAMRRRGADDIQPSWLDV